jgi:hypothetical protein
MSTQALMVGHMAKARKSCRDHFKGGYLRERECLAYHMEREISQARTDFAYAA